MTAYRSFLAFCSLLSLAFLGLSAGPACLGQEDAPEVPTIAVEDLNSSDSNPGDGQVSSVAMSAHATFGVNCEAQNTCYSSAQQQCVYTNTSANLCRLSNGTCGSCSGTGTPAAVPAPYAPTPNSTPPAPVANHYIEYLQDQDSSGTLTWNNGKGPQGVMEMGIGAVAFMRVPTLVFTAGGGGGVAVGAAAVAPLATATIVVLATGLTIYIVVVTMADAAKYEAWLEKNYVNDPSLVARRILENVRATAVPTPAISTPSKTPTPRPERQSCSLRCDFYNILTGAVCALLAESLTYEFNVFPNGKSGCEQLYDKIATELMPQNRNKIPGCQLLCPGRLPYGWGTNRCSCQGLGNAGW